MGGWIVDWPDARVRKATNRQARWDAVVGELGAEVWPELNPSFRIRPGETVFTIGSCFARNIEAHLKALGCEVPMLSLSFPTEEVGGQPHSTMNRFHPPAFRQCLEWTARIFDRDGVVAWDDCEPMAICCSKAPDETFFDLDMGYALPATRERFIERRQHIYDIFSKVFSAACMMMTPGFVEAFKDRATGLYIYGAPINKAMLSDPDRWELEVLSYERCLEDMLAAIDVVRARNPEVKVLITTSPVPLGVTFSGRDIRIANTYSKSVLRAVCDVVAAQRPMVDYFPSYETVMLSPPELAWGKDRLHVSQALIAKIVSRMIDSYMQDVGDFARLYQQAMTSMADHDLAGAEAAIRAALERQPDHLDARLVLAATLHHRGAHAEAEAEARAVNAAAPERADALFQLAHVLAAQGRMEEAIERIAEALDRPPVAQIQLYHARKIIARAPGPKALDVARRSVELFPLQSEVLEPLVQVLMREDRMDEALEVARRGRQLSGAPAGLGMSAAHILLVRGELEAAESEIEAVLAKYPGNAPAQRLRDKIRSKLARRRAAYQDGPMVTSTTLRSP